jgi:hypothetical protein
MSDMRSRLADPSKCPECEELVPDLYREQSHYTCQNCGRWRLTTGIITMPVTGPPGTPAERIYVEAPWWQFIDPPPTFTASGSQKQASQQQEAPPGRADEVPPQEPAILPAFAEPSYLAACLQQPVDRVDSYLRNYRKNHPDCCVQVPHQRKSEPKCLYRTAEVWPVLQAQLPRWRTLGSCELPPTDD